MCVCGVYVCVVAREAVAGTEIPGAGCGCGGQQSAGEQSG